MFRDNSFQSFGGMTEKALLPMQEERKRKNEWRQKREGVRVVEAWQWRIRDKWEMDNGEFYM